MSDRTSPRTRVLLVRHADAGVRGTWPGDDLERELSTLGTAQAAALAAALPTLAATPPRTVSSSRAARCIATVAPLAAACGVEVTTDPLLLEGADHTETLAWLEGPEAPDVACSHGDVIGGIVRTLAARGVVTGRPGWPKGGTWVLDLVDGAVVDARLDDPPRIG